jgi:hypothetical protein
MPFKMVTGHSSLRYGEWEIVLSAAGLSYRVDYCPVVRNKVSGGSFSRPGILVYKLADVKGGATDAGT